MASGKTAETVSRAGNAASKLCLTAGEAAAYSGIGVNRIRAMMAEPDCPFVLTVGKKRMIKREAFEEYIRSVKKI